jgi:hypothetical protein
MSIGNEIMTMNHEEGMTAEAHFPIVLSLSRIDNNVWKMNRRAKNLSCAP